MKSMSLFYSNKLVNSEELKFALEFEGTFSYASLLSKVRPFFNDKNKLLHSLQQ